MTNQLPRLHPPSRPRVLLVFKRSLYDLYVSEHQDPRISTLIAAGDQSVQTLKVAHERHRQSLDAVIDAFSRAPVELTVRYRGEIDRGAVAQADLVVVVGGDGTLLDASHHVADEPILGINSDPKSSVGFLCSAIAADVNALIEAYFAADLRVQPLARLEVTINGQPIAPLALNDVLFSHVCPASASKYFIEHGASSESHVSSGLWVATATGSTAAIRSAGGTPMALSDYRLQFVTREIYRPNDRSYALLHGYVEPDATLVLRPRMRTASVYLDGPHVSFSVGYGDEVVITTARVPLRRAIRHTP